MTKSRWVDRLPGMILFLLAPLVGEVLPGVRSITTLLNPVVFVILATLYGCGAIIVRDVVNRWGKGWPSVLVLGLAYGIIEEGIGAQSFVNPSWSGLDDPSQYSRFLGY